jgi:dimethylargininase
MARAFGRANGTGSLTRVLVRPPDPATLGAWQEYGWRGEPDPDVIASEHEGFREALAEAGAEVVVGTTPDPGNPDAIYACDPLLMADEGAILLRPGKPGRRGEPDAVARDLEAAGVPVIGRLEEPACAEGGDLLWLDHSTLVAGHGYRTNDEGIEALRKLLPSVDVISVDLPHDKGPEGLLHLRSLISLLDRDLALIYPPLMPVRFLQLLQDRGFELIEVPGEEYETKGTNVLALGPRVALALEGNRETRRRMEAAGVEVRTYRGDDLSVKGDGGPTCLTFPIARR